MKKAKSNEQQPKIRFGLHRWKRPEIPLEKGYIPSDQLIMALWEKRRQAETEAWEADHAAA